MSDRVNSFEIQAEIFSKLKAKLIDSNFEIRGEYKTLNCRFDLVILEKVSKKIIAIVEVKSYKYLRPPNLATKQISKYRKLCEKVFVIGRVEKIDETLNNVLCLLKNPAL